MRNNHSNTEKSTAYYVQKTVNCKFKAECAILINIRLHYTQHPENGSMQIIITDTYIVLNETTDTHFIAVSQISKQYYIADVNWAPKRVWLTFILWWTLVI